MSQKYPNNEETWALIRAEWESTDCTYGDLEKKYGIRRTTIRSRRNREGWVRPEIEEQTHPAMKKVDRSSRAKKTRRHTVVVGEEEVHIQMPKPQPDEKAEERKVSRQQIREEDLDDELNDLERLFCVHYMRYFNQTKAYQKAYGCSNSVARSNAHKLMQKPHIRKQIDRLKKEQVVALKLDAMDVLQQWIDIAFADITDFVEFGTEERVVDKKGKKTEQASYVRFKQDTEIDGMMVSEVRIGKDGIGLKLHNKMEALKMLSNYFDLLDLNTRRRLEEEKLKMEIAALKEIAGGEDDTKTIILSGEDHMRDYIAKQKAKRELLK